MHTSRQAGRAHHRPPSCRPSYRVLRPVSTTLVLPLAALLALILSPTATHAAPPRIPPHDSAPRRAPLSLHQTVDAYLQAGGHAALRTAFDLPANTYYDPLRFLTREPAVYTMRPPHHHRARRASRASRTRRATTTDTTASDLHLLRLMGLHVPGIDRLPTAAPSAAMLLRQTDDGCDADANPRIIPPLSQSLPKGHSRFQISFTANTPREVKDVVQSAVQRWSVLFTSPRIILRVCFTWRPIDDNTLGATTVPLFTFGKNFDKLQDDALYNPALASSLQDEDVIMGKSHHVHMILNRDINWHLDQSKLAPQDRFDLGTTVLHELTHGLFFSGTIKVPVSERTAQFQQKHPGRFDQFLEAEKDIAVARECINGSPLFNAIRSPRLRFTDSESSTTLGLYAPHVFASGSSVYHFNNETIEEDCEKMRISKRDCSDLMTHELEQGYTQRKIGLTTMRVYHAMRSAARGVVSKSECNVPNYVASSDTSNKRANATFKLPTWGIATVAVAGVIGTVLFVGVIVITVSARS